MAAATDINSRIADRVKALRADRGLSLEALSRRCDVSRSMLSLVERGESSATAVVLDRIATGLGVPLAALFEAAAAPPVPLSRAADRTPWRDPQSGYVRCNVSPAGYPAPFQIVAVELPPGARVAYEGRPRAPFHQQIWLEEGALEVTLGRERQRLGPGDCLAMQVDGPTAFRNLARKPARYVVVVATDAAHGRR